MVVADVVLDFVFEMVVGDFVIDFVLDFVLEVVFDDIEPDSVLEEGVVDNVVLDLSDTRATIVMPKVPPTALCTMKP